MPSAKRRPGRGTLSNENTQMEKQSREVEENFMTSALDIALDHIARFDLMQDRHTLLTARLVCKHWRTHDAFTGKITDISIHKLEHLEALVKYQSVGPAPRGTWPTLEQTQVFPNLKTLRFGAISPVQTEDRARFPARLWREVCLQYSLSVADINLKSMIELLTELKILKFAKIHEVVRTGEGTIALDDSIDSKLLGLQSLSRLSYSIEANGTATEQISIPSVFYSMSKLHNLHIDAAFNNCAKLAQLLTRCSPLTNLSSLNLDLNLNLAQAGDAPESEAQVTISDVRNTLLTIPLPSLKTCRIHTHDGSATFESGNLCDFEPNVRLPVDTRQPTGHVLERVSNFLASAGAERGQSICLRLLIPPVAVGTALPEHPDPEALEPPCENLAELKLPTFQVTSLLFESDWGIDPMLWLPQFSFFLQGLRHLHISAFQTEQPTSLSVLTELSNLTHLSIIPYARSVDVLEPKEIVFLNVSDTAFLPPRLRKLDLSVKDLKPSGVSLTQLTHLRLNSGDACNVLEAFVGCGAPLLELAFVGRQSIESIVGTFPRLQKLTCDIIAPDLKPLADLKLLRELDITICEAVGMVTGVSYLTQLAALSIIAKKGSAANLQELQQLTTLKSLHAQLWGMNYSTEQSETYTVIEEGMAWFKCWEGFHQQSGIFKSSMPMTNVTLFLLHGNNSATRARGRFFF